MNQILLEVEWEGSGDIISQSSDNVLPAVDIMPEENFLVPDQGYRHWKYSHKEINTSLAGSSQTVEKRLPLNPFILSEAQEINDEMGETGEESNQSSSESKIKSPVIVKKYRKVCNRSELGEIKFFYSHFIKLLISIISFAFCFAGINLNYIKSTFLYQ